MCSPLQLGSDEEILVKIDEEALLGPPPEGPKQPKERIVAKKPTPKERIVAGKQAPKISGFRISKKKKETVKDFLDDAAEFDAQYKGHEKARKRTKNIEFVNA
ncbi:hypothetical protein B9Z55_027870 [Caenorhabditis nigoni]|uniref:Uncharacterized protein n=1 Tax=Caenorhabditis nigoni TaxID=1611254 RepID=A0A2G5SEC4_9PELO|nr:hypothetical protein B9Z55_027870 [Caenorhabditis nigoni]